MNGTGVFHSFPVKFGSSQNDFSVGKWPLERKASRQNRRGSHKVPTFWGRILGAFLHCRPEAGAPADECAHGPSRGVDRRACCTALSDVAESPRACVLWVWIAPAVNLVRLTCA